MSSNLSFVGLGQSSSILGVMHWGRYRPLHRAFSLAGQPKDGVRKQIISGVCNDGATRLAGLQPTTPLTGTSTSKTATTLKPGRLHLGNTRAVRTERLRYSIP